LTGGNFWQSAATGLTVSLLNHAAHSSKDKTNYPGKIKFKGLNKEELSDFSVIREDPVGNENPLFSLENNILYDTDGFYLKNVTNSDENYCFKIGDGKRVEVTPSENGNYGKYNIFYVPHKGGNFIEFMLPSSFGLKSVKSPHWTYNPFYNSSKWINPNK